MKNKDADDKEDDQAKSEIIEDDNQEEEKKNQEADKPLSETEVTEKPEDVDIKCPELEEAEKKDLVKNTKTKVKDVIENIHLPKMPKISKPSFLKKSSKEVKDSSPDNEVVDASDKVEIDEKDTNDDKKEILNSENPKVFITDEENKNVSPVKDSDNKENVLENDTGNEENEKVKDEAEVSDNSVLEKKSSIMDTLKSFKPPKMPNIFSKVKADNDEESAREESEQLLEEDKLDNEGKEEEKKEKDKDEKSSSLLTSMRSVVPLMFKKKSSLKEKDVEAGEADELLTNKEGENKEEIVKMEEINLDDEEKKDDTDNQSHTSEKKDPEKDDKEEDKIKSSTDRLKEIPTEAVRHFSSLDQQRKCSIIGVLLGLTLLITILLIAALVPGGWANHHRLVESGKFVETQTGCGKVWGHVEGEDMFMFRSLPYSVQVDRFEHSRLPASLDECGDELLLPANESRTCLRRTKLGTVGEEDCLTLDIATSSVVYNDLRPVVLFIPGDDPNLVPSSKLAKDTNTVWVTVSVRQGVLGFLRHDEISKTSTPPTSGNYGLGDLITALKWVQSNIEHFGGDNSRVTVLGHKQGASLVTALTAAEEGRGLYNRLWISGGAGRFGGNVDDHWNSVVQSVCDDDVTECLQDLEVEKLLEAVDNEGESWSHDNLPTRGETEMMTWITVDSHILTNELSDTWNNTPLKVPIIIGTTAQSEANSVNYQFSNWNDTDEVANIVESSLGNIDGNLPSLVLEMYNTTENTWTNYISMVSDVRTVCPLIELANELNTVKHDEKVVNKASVYVVDVPNLKGDSGNVADSSMDIAAILGLLEDDSKYVSNIQSKFYGFVRGNIDSLLGGVTLFKGENVAKVNQWDNCNFWKNTTDKLVPNFSKKF